MKKLYLGAFVLTFFSAAAFAANSVYEIDTLGAEDSPPSIDDLQAYNTAEIPADYVNITPSSTFWLLGGNKIAGRWQGMIPLCGDGFHNIFYGMGEFNTTFKKSQEYSANLGFNYRHMVDDSYFLGGYVFAGANKSSLGSNFWLGNIGIEAISDVWNFRASAYIPLKERNWIVHEKGVSVGEEAGLGFDAEFGRVIPLTEKRTLWLFFGGYQVMLQKTPRITGGEIRLVCPLTNYVSLEAMDLYDKQRGNIVLGGFRLTFGGCDSENKYALGVAGHMSDPIEHNLAGFYRGNSTVVIESAR